MNPARKRKILISVVLVVVAVACLWVPVYKVLFPEKVQAANDKYQAWLATNQVSSK